MEGTDTEGGHIYTDIGDKYRIVQFFQGACNAELHVPLFQSFFVSKLQKRKCKIALLHEMSYAREEILL